MSERSHYFVDQELIEEMTRLLKQDRLFNKLFGGLLVERPDFAGISQIIDLACGPGGWASDVARTFPKKQVVGVDISERMIRFAQSQSIDLDNVLFQKMDITQIPLPYPDQAFDFINVRLIYSFMTVDLWPLLIQECYRLTRPGGFLRVTQEDARMSTNSPALDEMYRIGALALFKKGVGFSQHYLGVIPRLQEFFRDAGYRELDQRHYVIDIGHGAEAYEGAYEDHKTLFKLLQKTLYLRQGVVSSLEEIEELYQNMLIEMQQEQFRAFWHFSSVFGQKPRW